MISYRCENKCGRTIGSTTYYVERPRVCPRCGGKIVKEKTCKSPKDYNNINNINVGVRWNAQIMQVGLDKVYCPTRQSYLDACKHGRVIEAGTRKISTVEIDPVGAKG